MRLINYLKFRRLEKAGVIPYVYNNGFEFLFMVPSNPNYGGYEPQIAKGKVDKGENIQDAAIREGREELGLTTYKSIHYLGQYKFRNPLHMYSMELNNKQLNTPHYETKKVVWLKYNQILENVRTEQLPIIVDCVNKILSLEK